MPRNDPLRERGPTPANGRGDQNKITKPQSRDCKGCAHSREQTKSEENHVRKNHHSDSPKSTPNQD